MILTITLVRVKHYYPKREIMKSERGKDGKEGSNGKGKEGMGPKGKRKGK